MGILLFNLHQTRKTIKLNVLIYEGLTMAKFGRPTKYSDEMLESAMAYLREFEIPSNEREGVVAQEIIPTIVGLCRYIDRAKSTVYKWLKEDDKGDFSDIVSAIEESQHIALVSGGLSGGFNPMITKLMMGKHGYSDKQDVDHSSKDKSMSPTGFNDFYDKPEETEEPTE